MTSAPVSTGLPGFDTVLHNYTRKPS